MCIFILSSGIIFSLTTADKLSDYIVGAANEAIESEELIKEFEHVIIDDVYGSEIPIEKVTNELQDTLREKDSKINTMAVDDVYNETAEAKANINVWYLAKRCSAARFCSTYLILLEHL